MTTLAEHAPAPSATSAPSAVAAAPVHFGQWLKAEIYAREMTVRDFGDAVQIPASSLWGWIATAAPGIRGDNLARLARGLKLRLAEVESKLADALAGGQQ